MSKKSKNTKSKIVSAAWELFYKQGYDDTTVDDIVELSQTSKGSFYHYFASKDQLLGSLSYLFDEKYEELESGITEDTDAYDQLLFLNEQLFDMIDNKIDPNLLAKLYSTQLVMQGEKSLLDQNRLYYRLLRRIVIRGQEKGELLTDLTANEIVRIYAMCERSLISEWCLCNWNFSLCSYAKQILPIMLHGIRRK